MESLKLGNKIIIIEQHRGYKEAVEVLTQHTNKGDVVVIKSDSGKILPDDKYEVLAINTYEGCFDLDNIEVKIRNIKTGEIKKHSAVY